MRPLSLPALLGYGFLGLVVFVSFLPLAVALKTALTDPADMFASASSLLPPRLTFGNLLRVLGLPSDIVLTSVKASPVNFLLALRNSLIYTTALVAGQLFFSALAAYAFARLRFPGRDLIFYAFLSATMIPAMVLFIPNFILIKDLGWLDSFAGMLAPSILVSPFAIFFLRQFFLGSPRDLEDAARIDGCTPFQVFLLVALPLQKGPLATLAILLSINAWNDFFWPFLVGRSDEVQVMAVAISNFLSQTGQGTPDWTGLMSAVCLSILPVMALLAFFGRHIVESLQTSGMK